MPGDLVYFWIPVPDGEAAKRFYGELLGWEFAPGSHAGGSQITNVTPHGGISGAADSASHPQVVFQGPASTSGRRTKRRRAAAHARGARASR